MLRFVAVPFHLVPEDRRSLMFEERILNDLFRRSARYSRADRNGRSFQEGAADHVLNVLLKSPS
jgi:hypothetical protein